MDTLLYTTKVFLSSVCYSLLLNDVVWDNILFLFMSGNFIGILFCQNGGGHFHNVCNLFMIRFNG